MEFDRWAILWAACAGRGLMPDVARGLEVWVVASVIGANRSAAEERAADPWPEDGPYILNVRRALAFGDGRPEPTHDDPIGLDEYRRLRNEVRT
jgi:hypothetical protein